MFLSAAYALAESESLKRYFFIKSYRIMCDSRPVF